MTATPSALVVYREPDEVRKDLDAMVPVLTEVLPNGMDRARFVRVVAKAIIENPKLMECSRASLVAAVHEAAQLGLEPTGLLGSAYLVPYRRKIKDGAKDRWISEAKLIPGYRGLIDLARRSGEIEGIEARVVRKRDLFTIEEGTSPRIVHARFVPDPTASPEERDPGPIVGVYMVATLRGGYQQTEWMTYDEVEAVRKRSKAADEGPWVTDPSEMARKTVVRRGAKYLPLTTEFRRALELDEEAERGADDPGPARPTSRATAMLLDRAARKTATESGSSGTSGDTAEDAAVASEAPTGSSEGEDGEYREVGPCDIDGCRLIEGHEGDHDPTPLP